MVEALTVHIVDDNEEMILSLSELFQANGWVVSTYLSGVDLLNSLPGSGLILLDVRLAEGPSGIRTFSMLRAKACLLPVIFLTGHGDIAMAVEALKLGAADFITKPFRNQDLLDRAYDALSNRGTDKTKELPKQYHSLTAREKEVLFKLCEGSSAKVIANQLQISVHTIEVHRANILKKCQVRSTPQLVTKAIRDGFC